MSTVTGLCQGTSGLPCGGSADLLPGQVDHRHQMTGALARAAWALRQNLSFYDALYVALAAALDAPLITADRRLSGAPALGCVVEHVVG